MIPEVLVGLLRGLWSKLGAEYIFGAAGSYSVWAGTQSSNGTPGGVLDTIWSNVKDAVSAFISVQSGTIFTAHKATRSAISHWALANEKAQAAWYTHLNVLAKATYASNLDNINTAAAAIETLSVRVNDNARYKDGTLVKTRATTALNTATTALQRTHSLSTTMTREHAAQVKLNVHYTHAIDVTLPRTIGGIRTREEALSRDQAKLKERTTSLENGAIKTFEWIYRHPLSAVTGVFAGAVAIALQRIGWGVLRCRSWQKLGRSLTCGMGSLLADLLAGVIDVLIVADLCQLTGLMLQVAESSEVQTVLTDLTSGIESLMRCQGVTRADELAGYWTDPPPAQAFSSLPVAA